MEPHDSVQATVARALARKEPELLVGCPIFHIPRTSSGLVFIVQCSFAHAAASPS